MSRWLAALFLLLAAGAFILNQWLVGRIASQEKIEREGGRSRLLAAEEELRRIRTQTTAVTSSLDKLTAPRKLSPTQITKLRDALATAEKGKVVITYLTVEWDAEEYARQLGSVLQEIGYDVTVSDHLWVTLDHDGLFLVSTSEPLPATAMALQSAFTKLGIEVPAHPPGEIAKELGAKQDETILVVSNR